MRQDKWTLEYLTFLLSAIPFRLKMSHKTDKTLSSLEVRIRKDRFGLGEK